MRNLIRFLFSILMLVLLVSCSSGSDRDSPSDADPAIKIYTSDQLIAMAQDKDNYDKKYVLMDDISLVGSWTPIGDKDTPFSGTFDGNGHTISGVYIHDTSVDYQGLFGYISKMGEVKNLGVLDVDITGHDYAGGIAGYNAGDISASYSTGIVTAGIDYAGGIVGDNPGVISNSYSTCNVIAARYNAGGIVGFSTGKIRSSYSLGTVTANNYAGGIAGYNGNIISDCVALNDRIATSLGMAAGRITGSSGPLENNHAFDEMLVTNSRVSDQTITDGLADNTHGANITKGDAETVAFWRNTLGFDETVWDLDFDGREYKLPLLKKVDAASQPAELPLHLR